MNVLDYTAPDIEETEEMGSYNHSLIQANLIYLLKRLDRFSVFSELSLDASRLDRSQYNVRDEIKPDVCIYPKRTLSRPFDIIKMSEMPLLAIEILSPRQGGLEIVEKIAAYLALGVKSCWMVDPTTAIVAVYHDLSHPVIYSSDEVVDDLIEIRLPVAEIFQ